MLKSAKQLDFLSETKEQETIEFIKQNEPKGEPYALMYSGGKDSIVLEDLTRKSGVKYKIYYSLMPDPPELLKFIKSRKIEINVLHPKHSWWHGITYYFPPHRKAAWCCSEIKEAPSKHIGLTHRLLGVRAEESAKRAKLGKINKVTKKRINYHPIFDWKEWEIWEYIEKNNLEYCSLYDEGFDRLGCVVCPKRTNTKSQEKFRERWPQYFRLFEKKVNEWWEEKGKFREKEPANNVQEFLENWYNGK